MIGGNNNQKIKTLTINGFIFEQTEQTLKIKNTASSSYVLLNADGSFSFSDDVIIAPDEDFVSIKKQNEILHKISPNDFYNNKNKIVF